MGVAVAKRMLMQEASRGLGDTMQLEGWIQAGCMCHPDYRESSEAFAEESKPDFTGNTVHSR